MCMKTQKKLNWGKDGEEKNVLELEKAQYEDPSSLIKFWMNWETQETLRSKWLLYSWDSLEITASGVAKLASQFITPS